jgi:hypothetical protein
MSSDDKSVTLHSYTLHISNIISIMFISRVDVDMTHIPAFDTFPVDMANIPFDSDDDEDMDFNAYGSNRNRNRNGGNHVRYDADGVRLPDPVVNQRLIGGRGECIQV